MEAYFAVPIFVFLFWSAVSGIDLCAENICNGSKLHTLCKYKTEGPATHCQHYENTIKNNGDKKAIVDKINKRRNMIAMGEVRSFPSAADMRKLVWSEQLSTSAQRWADQCVSHQILDKQDDCRDLVNMAVGQNIATVMGDSPGLTPAALVDVWYMELMNINSTIIAGYQSLATTKGFHHDYFTQLVWAESTHVGCGGVKFKENTISSDSTKIRTINRLVCNFSPKGNIVGKPVYEIGKPCSSCPEQSYCDGEYEALCYTDPSTIKATEGLSLEQTVTFLPQKVATLTRYRNLFDVISQEKYPHLFDLTSNMTSHKSEKHHETNTNPIHDEFKDITNSQLSLKTTVKTCHNNQLLDELLFLLKKKFNNELDGYRQESSTKMFEETIDDVAVEDFIRKLYKNEVSSTTERTTQNDILNSTSLVNLVEAVIFRNLGKLSSVQIEKSTETTTQVMPVEIKHLRPELASVIPNGEFDGHYFFPEEDDEDDGVDNMSSTRSETYYDTYSSLSPTDILAEIRNIKSKSETSDFLEDILDAEDIPEVTTRAPTIIISPDDMGLIKDGYYNMKRFLDEIGEKKELKFNKM